MKAYPLVVFISGAGSTLKAIIDAANNYKIVAIICNNPDALGIEHAIKANIPCHVIDHSKFADKQSFEAEIIRCLSFHDFKLIALAGFMRILSPEFVAHYPDQIINIHPSLLPKYPGLNTYHKALANNDTEHGTTIHYVSPEVDSGTIIAQEKFAISKDDDNNSLAQKTKSIEQKLYPQVLNDFMPKYAQKDAK